MIQLGIIGAGRIGRVHGEGITHHVNGARVAAVADPMLNDDTRRWAEGLGATCSSDYHDILNDPSINAVLICSSTDTHAPISLEAIAAGKHVFCEKPVSQDPAQVAQVMEALKGKSLKYQVGFNRRFDHNFEAVRAAVADGRIGAPHIVKITSRDPEPPPVSYVKVSGGMFLDMTIHDFDMVRYLTGSEVAEVTAVAASLVDPAIGAAGDVDTAIITMRLENGALAVIDNSRRAAYGYDQRAEVFGDLGQVAVSNDTPSTARLSTADGVCGEKPLYFFLERYMQSFAKEVGLFVKAITDDTPVPVDVNDGLQAVRIALAAKKAMDENRSVRLSELPF